MHGYKVSFGGNIIKTDANNIEKKITTDSGKLMVKSLISDINTAILRWYPFKDTDDIFYIGSDDDVFSWLEETYGNRVRLFSVGDDLVGLADRIICIGYLEQYESVSEILAQFKRHLKADGRVILGMNNRLGIKYFCGDRDLYTGRIFDCVEDYYKTYSNSADLFSGRMYDRDQIELILQRAGLLDSKFYSVFSDLNNASFIFADGYLPNEQLYIRIFPTYNAPDTVFLEEGRLYDGLIRNGLFHRMANAFLIECSSDGTHTDALQITSSMDRGPDDAMITVIHDNDTVTKQAVHVQGIKKLRQLSENMQKLKEKGVCVVEGRLENDVYSMPYIHAETGMRYLERLYLTDRKLFIDRLDEFREAIIKACDIYEGDYVFKGKKESVNLEKIHLAKEAMVDMIPLNSFFLDGKFVFFDQEFCIENYPLDAIIYRMIQSIFVSTPTERSELLRRYGIDVDDSKSLSFISQISNEWLYDLRKEKDLYDYYKKIRANQTSLNANRQRINYSVEDYQRLFVDIFDYADIRKLVLFGSGVYAKRFLALYGADLNITAVVDNNEKNWGKKLYPAGYDPGNVENNAKFEGIKICSPVFLRDLSHGSFKIIICIKNYLSVMKQLDDMGISEYSVFDPEKAYSRKRHPLTEESVKAYNNSTVKGGGKKYHVGYIAGVFDLYHIGHLNMFRRAKEMCDYLIVGVVSDEGVRNFKGTEPFIPFSERIEMVSSCRYVDEVVEIPYMFGGTEEAWKMHHFDVQFSGSDYVNDPNFERFKVFLEKHGATLEFFPYTESTSSTKLKALIDKKLL